MNKVLKLFVVFLFGYAAVVQSGLGQKPSKLLTRVQIPVAAPLTLLEKNH